MAKEERRRNNHGPDHVDYALLDIIQKDCDKSAVELSEALAEKGLTLGSAACGNRINALSSNGFIKNRCAILRPEKFNLHQLCFMVVKMHKQDTESRTKFLSVAKEEDAILEIYEMAGLCDYLMKVLVVNIGEATRLSQKLSQAVADIQTYPAGGTQKWTTAIPLRPRK